MFLIINSDEGVQVLPPAAAIHVCQPIFIDNVEGTLEIMTIRETYEFHKVRVFSVRLERSALVFFTTCSNPVMHIVLCLSFNEWRGGVLTLRV